MAFPVSSLPRFAKLALSSSHLYVSHEEDGSLKFREEKLDEPLFNQFELEEAKVGKGLLHIKSRTTNKYWVLAGPDSIFIKAAADQPNENQLDPYCTLVQLVNIQDSSVKFSFVHSNKLLCHCIPNGTGPAMQFLSIEMDEQSTLPYNTAQIRFDVIDCGAMPVVPKHPYHSYRYVVLRCSYNKKYLQLTNKVDNGFADGSIRGDQGDALSPNSKFELERPNADNKRLCHIRSCYNNKYLTMEGGIIKAVASHPNPKPNKEDGSAQVEEDKEGYYHTLFELVHAADGDRIQLRLVHSQRLVAYSQFTESLFQQSEEEYVPYIQTELSVFDWEKFVILPKHVAFKGQNGNYLATHIFGRTPYLRFEANDILDNEAAHEITYTPDGLSVRIKCHTGKFWKNENGGIRADNEGWDSDDTLFVPIKTGANIVALRCRGSELFCKLGGDSWLSAKDETFDQFACLTVEERVYKREIKNINFRLADARIYNETIKTMVTREASNHNSEKETVQLRLLYQQKRSHTFNRGFSMSQSIEVEFKCQVPFIGETGFAVTLGSEQSFNWGDTTETTSDVETTHVVTVPEYSKVQVRLVATEGKCDVPFSYVVHDTLMSGTERTYEMFGGIYTGVSNYNFRYETVKLPLDGLKSEGTALI